MVLIKRFDPSTILFEIHFNHGRTIWWVIWDIYICVNVMGNSFQSRRSYIQMYWSLYSIGNINMRVFPGRNYPKQYMLIVFDHVHYYLTVGKINKTITVLLIVFVCVCWMTYVICPALYIPLQVINVDIDDTSFVSLT